MRISERLLVQRVDDVIVIIDESSGQEITFPIEEIMRFAQALSILSRGEGERS